MLPIPQDVLIIMTLCVCDALTIIIMLIMQVDQLREFHKQHYNPTNGHFYTYGDMPLATHLQRINEEFLCNFERVPRTDSVAREPKWDKPVSLWTLSLINDIPRAAFSLLIEGASYSW